MESSGVGFLGDTAETRAKPPRFPTSKSSIELGKYDGTVCFQVIEARQEFSATRDFDLTTSLEMPLANQVVLVNMPPSDGRVCSILSRYAPPSS